MAIDHYENFPVGSILLPSYMRSAVHAIYRFARHADDIADEGEASPAGRLAELAELEQELVRMQQGLAPHSQLMRDLLHQAVVPFALTLQPFHDLLYAFQQDVHKNRYQNFAELMHYCRHSANPVGRLMLQIMQHTDALSLAQSDAICTALQLINFWQDIAIDWQKGRIYLPQDDMAAMNIDETHIAQGAYNENFVRLMERQCARTRAILLTGAPLARKLPGRLGLELRLIVAGALRVLEKLSAVQFDVFTRRPTIQASDALHLLKLALVAQP